MTNIAAPLNEPDPGMPARDRRESPLGSAFGMAALLLNAVRLLLRYDEADMGSEERLALVTAMEDALWLSFPARVEPRRTVAAALRGASDEAMPRLEEAVASLIRDHGLGAAEMRMLLSLLVDTQATLSTHIVFECFAHLSSIAAREDVAEAAALLVPLLRGQGASTISLLERLRRHGLIGSSAVEAALRSIARSDPARLEAVIDMFGPELTIEEEDVESFRFLIADLVERAGGFTVLSAISVLEPEAHRGLFAAAFGGSAPPFALTFDANGESSEAEQRVRSKDGAYPLDLIGGKASEPLWALKVRWASAAVPRIELDVRTWALEDEIDCADEQECSVATAFGRHMGVPMAVACEREAA